MNKVILIGRLVKEPELRKTSTDLSVVTNTIAVNRKFKSQNGETEADFINFVAFGATAELIANYHNKGDRIGLEGRIQTRSYDNLEGVRVYVTEVVVDNIVFLQDKKQNPTEKRNTYGNYEDAKEVDQESGFDGFMDSDDLPF